MKKENIKNGDYCYAPGLQGVYIDGGLVLDFADESADLEDFGRD